MRPLHSTSGLNVLGPALLCDSGHVCRAVTEMFEAAQACGTIPRDRDPLGGASNALWTMDERTGAIIAVAIFYDVGNSRLWLDFLYVDVRMRRRGHAVALLQRLRDVARDGGFKRVMLGTSVGNLPMQRLAKRVGFADDHVVMACSVEVPKR